MVPEAGVVVREDPAGEPVEASGEFAPREFRSVALIEDEAGGQVERIPLYVDEPMVFQLGADWQGEGRKAGGVGIGHFIVIVPATWTRLGDAPVDPEACVDGGFRAHYFYRGRGDREPVQGFVEHGVSSSVIELVGERLFDESEQGELFVGDPPVLKAPGMALARVGEEGGQGWGETYRLLHGGRSLGDVLNGRQGWFFIRVYREGSGVEVDSVQFRYLGDLRQIRVAGEPYAEDTVLVPTKSGHRKVEVEIVCADDAGVSIADATDGMSGFVQQGGTVTCPPDPEVKRLHCRVQGQRGGAEVVVGLPRVWWRLAPPGGPATAWRDTAQAVTRDEFQRLASAGKEVEIDLPERVSRVAVGFEDEGRVDYRAHRSGAGRVVSFPLADFRDHAEIDRRLCQDTVLGVRCAGSRIETIRVAADPPPRIVDFSARPSRVSPGDAVDVRWSVEDCEGVAVSLTPGIGPVDAEGSCKIRVEHTTVVTLTLSAPAMVDLVEELPIEVEEQPANDGQPVAQAKALGVWRPAKGFSPGELAAVPGVTGVRADRRRRSVHAVNVATLERWSNEQQ